MLGKLPAVAREAIRARLESRAPAPPVEPRGELARAAPVFVTLKIAGALRGCMGQLPARHADLVAETMARALAAAFEDPRFEPLRLEELVATTIEVAILGPLVPIETRDELDAARFGIEVRDTEGRSAVLLPAIEGIASVDQQIAVARRKASILEEAVIRIRRFEAVKVSED